MCTGIPVVVTDVGDMGGLTKEYGVGRVARPEDPRSLAAEMRTIMKEDLDAYRLNTAKVAKLWSLPVTVSQYLVDVGKMKKRNGHI
jgi:glycosyltransferase involved in cell wall biosynthesis